MPHPARPLSTPTGLWLPPYNTYTLPQFLHLQRRHGSILANILHKIPFFVIQQMHDLRHFQRVIYGGIIVNESLPSPKERTSGKISPWIVTLIFLLIMLLCLSVTTILAYNHILPCKFTHKVSFTRSMTDQESQVLTVSLYGEDVNCTVNVQLDITNFDISPSANIQRASIIAHQTTRVVWVLSPKSQGKYSYVVSFPDSETLDIDESTVSVTNDIGLPAWVTSVLTPVAVAVLGPLLTAPFWLGKYTEWIKERRKKRKVISSKRKAKKR